MRVLVPPRDEVVARVGIGRRRVCGATHRPGLPTKSVPKRSTAGPDRMGEVGSSKLDRCCCGWAALPVPVFMDLVISVAVPVRICERTSLRLKGSGVFVVFWSSKKAWPPNFGGHAGCDSRLSISRTSGFCPWRVCGGVYSAGLASGRGPRPWPSGPPPGPPGPPGPRRLPVFLPPGPRR